MLLVYLAIDFSMIRREFLKVATATITGFSFLKTKHATTCEQPFIIEKDIDHVVEHVFDGLSWNDKPQIVNGDYVDAQGTLKIRAILGNALLHPLSHPRTRSYVRFHNSLWGGVKIEANVPSMMIRGTCFELPVTTFATPRHSTVVDTLNIIKTTGEGLLCPGSYLLGVRVCSKITYRITLASN
jgi:hypothetical protein